MSTNKPDLGPDDNAMPVWMGELCERFKDAWGSNNPISVESIVDRIPADRRTIALKTLVEAEYVLRSATNDGLTAKELAQRFRNDADLVLNIHRRLAGYSSPSNRETIAPRNAPANNEVESGSKALQIPRQLGRYRIVRKLGQGAMGTVFLAKDEQLDRQVALKFPRGNLQKGGEQQARFLQEAQAAAALHHANICPIYDAGEIQGINYICMGYVDGAPLSQFAVQDSGLTEQQIARIILQVAKAVAAAHGAGFIHRDLKPANIMIDLNNEPVILDFGLARRIKRSDDQRVTQAGAIMGSPCYMSPEQVDGDEQRIGPPSDVYSLGVILYEMLTGQVPFEGSFASVMGQIMTKTPDRPSVYRKNLSVRLESICNKMMAKQQDQRFRSMASVADALQEYLDKFDGPDSATADGNTNETAPTTKGEQRKQHIEQLIKASDYGQAETLLVSLSRENSDALQQYAVWAAAELPKLRKLREQVRTGRQEIYETATRLMKTYDYEQVVRLLSDYPYDIRTPNMQQLLERAERLSNDVERLSKGIAAARTRGDNDSLIKLLPEKLKLKPHDREAKELYDQLLRRSEGPISKVLGGNTPRTVQSIPAALQWLLIFVLVVPMCAVPAYIWSQKYLARESKKNELPIAFNEQKIVNADEANAPEPPKPDQNQPPVPPVNDVEPKVSPLPESIAPANVDSQLAQAPTVKASEGVFIVTLPRNELRHQNGWWSDQGELLLGGINREPLIRKPLMFQGRRSAHGIYMHARPSGESQMTFRVDRRYQMLLCEVIVPDMHQGQGDPRTPLRFKVVGDGRLLWRSNPMTKKGNHETCKTPVTGVKNLSLIIECAGPDNWGLAAWIEPQLFNATMTNSSVMDCWRQSPPDREVAEWVLGKGGKVFVGTNGAETLQIWAKDQLPSGEFNLMTIDLCNLKEIVDQDMRRLADLKSLSVLTVMGTSVTDFGLKELGEMTTLTSLNVAGTMINGSGFRHLAKLERLETLLCGGAPINDASLVYFKKLPRLTHLGLIDTQITDAGVSVIGSLSTLTELRLTGTKVTDRGLKHLKGLKNLEMLSVERTRVTKTGLSGFRAARPKCEVKSE